MPVIRRYQESDLAAVAGLFTDSVHRVASKYYDEQQVAAWAPPPDLKTWAARFASVETLVMEEDSELAGFISYTLDGHIDLLYTSPRYTRRGVASALYREAETIIVRHGAAEIFTEASLAARPFFERFGFRVVEEQAVERRGVVLRRFAMRKPAL